MLSLRRFAQSGTPLAIRAGGMLVQNIRYALRSLLKAPAFTLLAVATLALGIGANTAVFSVLDAVMLRSLPYPTADRLVSLWERLGNDDGVFVPGTGDVHYSVSPANLVDYGHDTHSFEGLAGFGWTARSLTRSGPPEQIGGAAVTWNYFSVLGVSPLLGRPFGPEDDRIGAPHVVVLTDSLWRARFAGSPGVIGQRILLDGETYEVVGVMPSSFDVSVFGFPEEVRFLEPAVYPEAWLTRRGNHIVRVLGRLEPDVTLEQAQDDLDAVTARLAHDFARTNRNVRARIAPLAPDLVRNARRPLLILAGAVALVLIVACVNVANLLLVRALGQRREIAVRMALGASRRQIMSELLTRGVVLGVLGGLVGLLTAAWTRDLLIAIAPSTIPRARDISLSLRVLGVTALMSIVSGMAAAVLPAFQISRSTAPALKDAGLSMSASRSVMRWRGAMVAAEIAAALVLAVGAGLLVHSLMRLNRVDLGFNTNRVLVMDVRLPDAGYPDASSRLAFFEELSARVRTLPGVEGASFANSFPLHGGWGSDFAPIGSSSAVGGNAGFQVVDPRYFATLGIPLVRGRLLSDNDRAGTAPVAVVTETFVRRFVRGGDPIGLRLDWDLGKNLPPLTIVGVVGEVRPNGKASDLDPEVYLTAAQTDLAVPAPARLNSFAVRTASDPQAFVTAIQKSVWSIDEEQPISGVKTLDEIIWASLSERRFNLLLLASVAVLAVGLALIGCYGVVSYAAAQRTREIGIRLAFGARRSDVVSLVVGSGLRWAILGIVAGVAGALALTRVMRSLLFDVTPTDPLTFATVVAAMIGVALIASYLPARRAAGIEPAAALRVE